MTVILTDEQIEIIRENIRRLGKIFKEGEERLKEYEEEAIKLNLYDEKYFEFLEMLEPIEEGDNE